MRVYSILFSVVASIASLSAPALASVPTVAEHGERAGAAMPVGPVLRDASKCPAKVVYVSDFNNNVVDIFPFGKTAICGQISGLAGPQGLDVDAKANLWIANTNASEILEFAPNGRSPIFTIPDRGEYPVDVKVGAGVIAVTNIFGVNARNGSVSVFQKNGTLINRATDPTVSHEYFAAIDRHGNVYTTAMNRKQTGGFVNVLAAPSYTTFVDDPNIALFFPGDIHVVGSDVIVGDQNLNTVCSYQNGGGTGNCATLSGGIGSRDIITFDFLDHGATLYGADALDAAAELFTFPGGVIQDSATIPLPGKNPMPIGIAVVGRDPG